MTEAEEIADLKARLIEVSRVVDYLMNLAINAQTPRKTRLPFSV